MINLLCIIDLATSLWIMQKRFTGAMKYPPCAPYINRGPQIEFVYNTRLNGNRNKFKLN